MVGFLVISPFHCLKCYRCCFAPRSPCTVVQALFAAWAGCPEDPGLLTAHQCGGGQLLGHLPPNVPDPIAFFSSKKHFKECINFIHCCRLNGGNCLVHW